MIAYNEQQTKSVEAQQKMYELTKSMREGYLDVIREMSTGMGEFEKIIGTQEMGASQLMNAVQGVGEGLVANSAVMGAQVPILKKGTAEYEKQKKLYDSMKEPLARHTPQGIKVKEEADEAAGLLLKDRIEEHAEKGVDTAAAPTPSDAQLGVARDTGIVYGKAPDTTAEEGARRAVRKEALEGTIPTHGGAGFGVEAKTAAATAEPVVVQDLPKGAPVPLMKGVTPGGYVPDLHPKGVGGPISATPMAPTTKGMGTSAEELAAEAGAGRGAGEVTVVVTLSDDLKGEIQNLKNVNARLADATRGT